MSIFRERGGTVSVTLPDGALVNEPFSWRYAVDDQGQTRVKFS